MPEGSSMPYKAVSVLGSQEHYISKGVYFVHSVNFLVFTEAKIKVSMGSSPWTITVLGKVNNFYPKAKVDR